MESAKQNSNNDLQPRVLLRPDAARYVALGLRTFDEHVKQRIIAHVRLSPRRIGFLIDDLNAFLRSRRVTGEN